MAFVNDVIKRLVDGGVGTANAAVNGIFASTKASIPSGPGPILTVVETGGTGPLRVQNQKPVVQKRPGAQITVRASTYPAASAMATNAYNSLSAVRNESINGVFYLEIIPLQEPFDMGLDDLGRARCGFNILAWSRT